MNFPAPSMGLCRDQGHNYLLWMIRIFSESSSDVHDLLKELKSCILEKDLERGTRIHAHAVAHRNDSNMYVMTTIMKMYSKCGSMVDARRVFDSFQTPDVVSWTALLLGYVENGEGATALNMFFMMKAHGCPPDSVTYVAALKACTSLAVNADRSGKGDCLKRGSEIHSEIGHQLNRYVQNTLIDMYAKCGSMENARRVFEGIGNPTVVSWSALLLGYVENGESDVALDMFFMMQADSGCPPNSVTYVAALKACGLIGALALGRKFHSEISEFTTPIVTCLIDLYAKSGSIIEAREAFDLHSKVRDVVTWNALLTGYCSFGDTDSVFSLFKAMQDEGFQPDAVTFVCMLSCCSHAGLVEKAKEYLKVMPVQYGVTPTQMHYNCMVDVLGRANQLNEAVSLLQKMPYIPNAVTWMTLLGACRKWKNVEIGRSAFQSLVDTGKSKYTLADHIYNSGGMWKEEERIQFRSSYVMDEVGKIFKFVVGGEEEDPAEVKVELEKINKGIKVQGIGESYRICPNSEDEDADCGHSERRAVIYGILKTPPTERIRAFKNMRMCDVCHGSIKIFSNLYGRVIMVRDTSRWHVMVNGCCSCGDYW